MRRQCNGAKHSTEATNHYVSNGGRGAFLSISEGELRGLLERREERMQV